MNKTYLTYKIILILAVPAAFWTSFEMYGLTMLGSQRLFYSISHAYPVIYSIVLLSLPFFFVTALFNSVLTLLSLFKENIIMPMNIVASILLFQLLHALALVTYEHWAPSGFRVLICIISLVSLFSVIVICYKEFVTYNKQIKRTQ